ncbi:PilN domain-containing protein [Thermovorax subterraneus]|nr:PilN domain-containing protein [Thermovorax subterraneus]
MHEINLLPEELRRSRKKLFNLQLPSVLLGTAFFILLSFHLFLLINSQFLGKKLENVKREIEFYEAREKEVVRQQELWQNLQKKKEEVKKVAESRIFWSKFLIEVEEVLPQDVWLKSIEVGPENKLKVVGVSSSFKRIGDFYVALKEVSLLENVTLESVQEKGEDESGRSLLEFTVIADIFP